MSNNKNNGTPNTTIACIICANAITFVFEYRSTTAPANSPKNIAGR